MTEPARTRIAPSPTGYVHIGNLRTALFNYFLSRQTGGQFLIRVEDTDRERFIEGAMEYLLNTFVELGLDYDEGPVVNEDGSISHKGPHAPYIQSERLDVYGPYIDQLLEQGDAYHCFCSKERLEEMREQQRATKQTPKYDRHCLGLSKEEVEKRIADGEKPVVRLKIPEGQTVVQDVVRGTITVNNADLDDQVLLKSDGFPTYHMGVVVDDALMKINTIIRGEEWLSSAPKHVILMNALGFDVPTFAHVPLLLNPDKTKLSKRQGDVAVRDFLDKGYLIPALLNFIGTLGFNPSGDREIYTMQELIDGFDITKVKKSGAVMNLEKLDWMNQQYLKEMTMKDIVEAAARFVDYDVSNLTVQRALFVERERVHRLDQFNDAVAPYLSYDLNDADILVWKKADAADAKAQLEGVKREVEGMPDDVFDEISHLDERLRAYIADNGLQNGNVLWPLRVALSGQQRSASPFEYLWVLGKEESVKRLERAIGLL